MSNYTSTGWSNKQTWNINMMYEETFANMAEEQEYDDVQHMADSFESLVNELEFDGVTEYTLSYDLLSDYLNQVDWEEIAAHYYEEPQAEEPEEDYTYEE
jgi:hypothetical protein